MEIVTNYQKMLIKCLKEEIRAFLTYSDNEKEANLREMAKDWLFNDEYNLGGEFSCIRICKNLGKNIETLRMNVLFAKGKQWTLEDYMDYTLYGEAPKRRKADDKNK